MNTTTKQDKFLEDLDVKAILGQDVAVSYTHLTLPTICSV